MEYGWTFADGIPPCFRTQLRTDPSHSGNKLITKELIYTIQELKMNNSTNEKIGLSVYFILFLAGILSLPIGYGILLQPVNSIIRNSLISSDLKNYLTIYSNFLLPLLVCSIFFAIAMYFFESRSYILSIKAFVISLVSSSIILITGFYIFPFLLPLLIFAAIWFISERIPGMKFPLKAFISIFSIPILINILFFSIIFAINK